MSKKGRPKSAREDAKNVTLKMTDEGWDLLQRQAKELGLTRSELLERFARGEIQDVDFLAGRQALGE